MKFKQVWAFLLAVCVAGGMAGWSIMSSGLAQLGPRSPSSPSPSIQFQVDPPLHEVRPASSPVRMTLQAMAADRTLLDDANVRIRLLTPPHNVWFTSDFPIVEGTTLLELNGIASDGQFQFEQTLPIRGQYRLDVDIAPQTAGAFAPFSRTLTFSVPENPVKYRNAAILMAILLLTGAIGGWVLGGDRPTTRGEVAPQPVRLVLSGATVVAIALLLLVNVSAEFAETHHTAAHAAHSSGSPSLPAIRQAQGIRVQLSGEPQATVGQLATQTVTVSDSVTGAALANTAVQLEVLGLEHEERISAFAGEADAAGQLAWQQQFFDGSPHQITATVTPKDGSPFVPLQVARVVDVEGIAPPLTIRLIGLLYFTALFAASLLVVLWVRRRRWKTRLLAG
jgi:hypothetical protein